MEHQILWMLASVHSTLDLVPVVISFEIVFACKATSDFLCLARSGIVSLVYADSRRRCHAPIPFKQSHRGGVIIVEQKLRKGLSLEAWRPIK
jgi:hypothetical protein